MKANKTKKTAKSNKSPNKASRATAESLPNAPVLYQRLAGQWYAFMEVAGEVYMGKVSEKQVEQVQEREAARVEKKSRNVPKDSSTDRGIGIEKAA
jgi:hypothetical protein